MEKIAHNSQASQDQFELTQLLKTLEQFNPRVIVEIGVHRGYSMLTWMEAFDPEVILGIDIDPRLAFEAVEKGMHNCVITADSATQSARDRLMSRLNGEYIDFLFIDGDHTKEAVMRDFGMYADLVRPDGGVVGLHDTRRTGPQWAGKVEAHEVFEHLRKECKSIEFWGGGDAPGTGLLIFQ